MNDSAPLTVYGSSCSYFTGKLEGYLRFKEIPYRLQPMTSELFSRIVPEKTGAQQMPAVTLPDGRWMTDTTPMIGWFEQQFPRYPILPGDPVQAFVCRLIEDYADAVGRHALLTPRFNTPAVEQPGGHDTRACRCMAIPRPGRTGYSTVSMSGSTQVLLNRRSCGP